MCMCLCLCVCVGGWQTCVCCLLEAPPPTVESLAGTQEAADAVRDQTQLCGFSAAQGERVKALKRDCEQDSAASSGK